MTFTIWCPAILDTVADAMAQVGNYTIRLSMLSKDAKWTKALKLMLADLKVALQVGRRKAVFTGLGKASIASFIAHRTKTLL
jgi:hypothetical protein